LPLGNGCQNRCVLSGCKLLKARGKCEMSVGHWPVDIASGRARIVTNIVKNCDRKWQRELLAAGFELPAEPVVSNGNRDGKRKTGISRLLE
jgi:hypothetical protein